MLPRVCARDPHGLVKAFEVTPMTNLAELVVRSVQFRKESRGFVQRKDYPLTDNVDWLKWVTARRGIDEAPILEAVDFPLPYVPVPREKYPPR